MNGHVLVLGACPQAASLGDLTGVEVLRGPMGQAALGLVRDLEPDLVVVDAGESAKEALAVIEAIALNGPGPWRHTIVLMDGPPEAIVQALDEGASDVVRRDISDAELVARVHAGLLAHRRVETALNERQRTTLLELAGAVAHRINQPLTSMSVIVETLIAQQGRGDLGADRLRGRLDELQGLVERTASIVKQIKSLVDYKTVPYVGAVRIIDLGPDGGRKERGPS